MKSPLGRGGFTLIELLIVVAIIGILAAIALPNFLEAQTRSKVARVKNDMRTIATALESYAADNKSYPPTGPMLPPRFRRMKPLTTPIPYLTSLPRDPFESTDANGPANWRIGLYSYGGSNTIDNPSVWALGSDGPDRGDDSPELFIYPGYSQERFYGQPEGFHTTIYDPTNGTVSKGDILRVSDYNL